MTLERSLGRLVKAGKLKRQQAGLDHIESLLNGARRNFEAAREVQSKVPEAAFKLYYDGLLQISRAVVLLAGYRPADGEQHKTTFLAAGEVLGPEFDDLVRRLQKFRIKRNDCIYEPKDLVGAIDAEAIEKIAGSFWAKVRARLKTQNPQLHLFPEF